MDIQGMGAKGGCDIVFLWRIYTGIIGGYYGWAYQERDNGWK